MSQAGNEVQTIRDGGFRIEISPDDLVALKDKSAWKSRRISLGSILWIILVIFIGFVVLKKADPNFFHMEDVPIVSFPFVLAMIAFFAWPTGMNNIHATPEHLEVIRLIRGNETGRWLFPRAAVKDIRFIAVPIGTRLHQVLFSHASTHTNAIAFEVEGNNVVMLRGIKGPEALIVLRSLQRLGFDVESDVAMQIMLEMQVERRSKRSRD